jgi:hypothetical protein
MKRKMLAAIMMISLCACGTDGGNNGTVPLESKALALTATETIKSHLMNLETTLKFLEASQLVEETFNWFGESGSMVCEPPITEPGEEPGEPFCFEESEPFEVEVEMDEIATEINDWLMTHVFVDSQVESDAGNVVTYLLDPTVFCVEDMKSDGSSTSIPKTPEPADGKFDSIDDEWEEESGPECADVLADVPIRIQVVSYSEGDLDIDLLFGTAKLAPLHMQLYGDLVSLEIDLAVTKAVAELFITAFGEDVGEAELPTVFTGKIRAELVRNSAQKYTMSYSILNPVQVGMTMDGDEFSFSLGTGNMSVSADGTAQSISWDMNMGNMNLVVPYQTFVNAWYEDDDSDDDFEEEWPGEDPEEPAVPADDITDEEIPQVSGTMELTIAGYTGSATFAADSESVALTGLGLGNGPTQLKVNGTTVFSMDLNPDHGRAFDLTFTMDGDDLTMKISPLFDLALNMHFTAIADDLDEIPSFLLDETLSILFDGAPEPTLLTTGGEDDEGTLMVAAGELTLASSAAPEETVFAATGQCLTITEEEDNFEGGDPQTPPENEEEEEEEEGHELLGMFTVEDCQ